MGIGRWSSASDTRSGRICLAPVRVIALVRFARRASQSDLLIDKEIRVLNSRRSDRLEFRSVLKSASVNRPICCKDDQLWISR
ncbi:hypothetical protein C2845_PM03G30520 [Panicum miliaceum]|uniref:Uncharacterized protein n=1 Tax=Panicum miliaceum TaxID=4540 RepID=A0A3L6T925_PANMI|nr:hypothetical protein C2845_PM03G30520 [Panicum miliaceum]